MSDEGYVREEIEVRIPMQALADGDPLRVFTLPTGTVIVSRDFVGWDRDRAIMKFIVEYRPS